MGLRESFEPLLGDWTGLEEQSASAWAPASSARAAMSFKLDLADTAVVQDYRQVRADGGEFLAHGVFLADGASLRWWQFDSYALPPVAAEGGWSDGELVLTKTTERGVAEHRFAVVADQLQYRIRVKMGDATDLTPFLAGAYRRISTH